MKYLIYIVTLCLSLSLLNCEDYLDIVPDNIATIDYAFFDRVGAERFLFTCYSYLPVLGDLDNDPSIIGGDEIFVHDMNQFYSPQWTSYLIKYEQNADNPYVNYWDGSRGGSNLMIAITDCNIFLENIFKVPDLEDYEKRRWAAEVKFLKAYYHFYLLRMYGPIPINDVNLPVSASQDQVRVYRQPFDECVKYIVDLIHESVPDLPLRISDRSTEMGRITQPIALALKAKLLLTAASPLFNGNQDYANFRDNRGVNLFNTEYDVDKWKIALDATKNAIDTAWLAGHTLYEFSDAIYDLSDTTKTLMSIRNAYGHKWNEEVIWGFTNSALYHLQKFSKPRLSIDDKSLQTSEPILSPSLKIVELFYSKNGVPIEEDLDYDYRNRFKVETSTSERYYIDKGTKTAILNQFREPRFYANLSFDNSIWYGNGRYRDVGTQPSSETPWVVRGKAGETSGRTSAYQYSISGYNVKKYVHFQTITGRTGSTWERMSFPAIRLADLYLMYAEARNEFYGPDEEAFIFIDLVRERAGLSGVLESWHNHSIYPDKPSTKEGFREIIRRERINELAFEGKRFWDLRRWKTALTEINNSRVQGWNVNGENEVEYYEVVDFQNPLKFTTKEYLWPISQRELRRNPNLIQNPYWKN